jgi:hypothetical protein
MGTCCVAEFRDCLVVMAEHQCKAGRTSAGPQSAASPSEQEHKQFRKILSLFR